MSRIKVLDCTLRDGGYVNDWNFGKGSIKIIVNSLLDSGTDYIECGFLKSRITEHSSKSLFSSFNSADQRLKELVPKNKKLLFMINYGDFEAYPIPEKEDSYVNGIRVAFHKKDMQGAMELCKDIKDKGYSVFVQPMNTMIYSEEELLELLSITNKLLPYAMYMVDSLGTMRGHDVKNLYRKYDETLNENIKVGFHSHNNLQLSFSNAQEFINHSGDRPIIIDSTLVGIGRGAGNLCTELITQHLNENNDGEYDLLPILTTIDEVLYPLQTKYQWGYTIPYYLAATCNCHPNYATFLSNKQTLRVKDISTLLKLIPEESKSMYNHKSIERIYLDFQSNRTNDSEHIESIREKVRGKSIAVVAPGRSYKNNIDKIFKYANPEDRLIISVNFIDPALNADMAFFGNVKRYSEYMDRIEQFAGQIIVSSNIKNNDVSNFIINYADYLNDDPNIIDNSGLMLINLLSRVGVEHIGLAGFDGFDADRRINYYDELGNVAERWHLQAQNKSVSTKIKQVSTRVGIDFITPSTYEN